MGQWLIADLSIVNVHFQLGCCWLRASCSFGSFSFGQLATFADGGGRNGSSLEIGQHRLDRRAADAEARGCLTKKPRLCGRHSGRRLAYADHGYSLAIRSVQCLHPPSRTARYAARFARSQ